MFMFSRRAASCFSFFADNDCPPSLAEAEIEFHCFKSSNPLQEEVEEVGVAFWALKVCNYNNGDCVHILLLALSQQWFLLIMKKHVSLPLTKQFYFAKLKLKDKTSDILCFFCYRQQIPCKNQKQQCVSHLSVLSHIPSLSAKLRVNLTESIHF